MILFCKHMVLYRLFIASKLMSSQRTSFFLSWVKGKKGPNYVKYTKIEQAKEIRLCWQYTAPEKAYFLKHIIYLFIFF